MARQHDLDLHVVCPQNGGLKVVDLESQQHAVAVLERGIAQAAVMMFYVPPVQLKNQLAV